MCDADGVVLGAGMVLGSGYVLTCAHVVRGPGTQAPVVDGRVPDTRLVIDFADRPDVQSVGAWVADGGWVPPSDDGRGDVALLELERPQPAGLATPLRRLPITWDRSVHSFGFPEQFEDGLWVRARLAGSCGPGGEWVQMNPWPPEERVRAGFSGAAVVDDETGYIIGMVVSKYTDAKASLSWMIPVETIVRHLPRITGWVSGSPAADQGFRVRPDSDIPDLDLARQLAT
ncbi:MAG: serine protease, partial [Actinobacteria bacterium]|nr:serine protease [Actinomycetota bacterium]